MILCEYFYTFTPCHATWSCQRAPEEEIKSRLSSAWALRRNALAKRYGNFRSPNTTRPKSASFNSEGNNSSSVWRGCPECRSRLKPKIDVGGKIKVVKFLVSINARETGPYISAYVAFASHPVGVLAEEVLSCRSRSQTRAHADHSFPGAKQSPCRSFFWKYRHRAEIYLLFLQVDIVQGYHRVHGRAFQSGILR